MKHLVTGATGFIGQRLCVRLAQSGDEVVALCRHPGTRMLDRPGIEQVSGDLNDLNSLIRAIRDCDSCFHVAALARQWHPDPTAFEKINVAGTQNVLNAVSESKCQRIVYTSTAGVFGASPKGKTIDEEAEIFEPPTTKYEESKLRAQRLVENAAGQGMHAVVVNPTRVFGPGPLNEANSLARIMARYRAGRWHWKPGDGSQIGNYVYVDDVVDGHVAALMRGRPGQKYILGGEDLSFAQLFEMIGEVFGRRNKLIGIPMFMIKLFAEFELWKANRFGIPPRLTPEFATKYCRDYRLSSDKAIRELGYHITPIRSAIQKTLEEL
jgi:nucleoside-diphosphate-sugar epimerase